MASNKTVPSKDDHGKLAPSKSEGPSCGYKVDKIEKIDGRLKCLYCSKIIKEPVQSTECGHRFCRGCFEFYAAEAIDGQMVCPAADCGATFSKTDMMPDKAFKRELNALDVGCYHCEGGKCNWRGKLMIYQEHLDANHTHFTCDMCPDKFFSKEELSEHIASACPGRFVACPLGAVCDSEKMSIEYPLAHLLSERHQEAITLLLTGKYNIPEPVDQDQTMESTSANEALEQETSEKLSELAEQVQQLNDKTVELSREYIKLNELHQVAVQEVNNFQTASNERNQIMANLQPRQNIIQKDIEVLKQSLEDNLHVSIDGTLTWRVDRVSERMADAQSERQSSIFSPTFYSTPNGYKMRARLYLHGDGNAKRTHMSLFFLLMKGDYDALLPWPFGYKVTFCLFDQTGTNRHIIDSFRPDVKSSSFQRPKTEMNVASGIPKFFPLPMIQQDDNPYVRDDTLFLKIIVDLNETPKTILPYLLTLNPGLPNHVQQVLINQEKAKLQPAATPTVPMNTCG